MPLPFSLPSPLLSVLIGGLCTLYSLRTRSSRDFGLAEFIALIIGLGLFFYGASTTSSLTNPLVGP